MQLEKHFSWRIIHKMWWRNYSQTLFKKIKIEHISGSIFWSFIYFVFIVCQVEGYRNWLKLSRRPLAFISNKVFLKKEKEVWNQSTSLIFSMVFEEKYFSCYIILSDQISMSGCLNFVRYWAICVFSFFVNQVVT